MLRGLTARFGQQHVRDAAPAVAERVAEAEIHADPFPHLVIDGLFPPASFKRLASAIPDEQYFESPGKTKLDLDTKDSDPYFSAAPEETRTAWREARDAIFREGRADHRPAAPRRPA